MTTYSKFLKGLPLLEGDSTIPGVALPKELAELLPTIFRKVKEFGCDFWPTVVEKLTYADISEIAAYGGFPVRYPHWSFGMEYEELQKGYEYGMHKIYEMVVNCCDPNTLVLTTKGTIKAKDVLKGNVVFGLNGEERNVVAVVNQPAAKTLNIKLNGCAVEHKCTLNHKWQVLDETGLCWKEAKDLRPGDVLVGSNVYNSFKNTPAKFNWGKEKVYNETASNVRHRLKDIHVTLEMTKPLAELLGIVIGDGSCGVISRENSISVTIDKKLESYIDHVKQLFSEVFVCEDFTIEQKDSVTVVTFCSKYAVDFFDSIGLSKGCTYKTKRIPWSIWQSSTEYRSAFLMGLFDTDGCSSGSITFSCYNKDLAKDVQIMLLEMGIRTHYSHVNNGNNDIHTLRITGKNSIEKFHERINFTLRYKQDWLEEVVNTGSSTNSGIHLPYIQKIIIELSQKLRINTYNNSSLGRSLKLMERQSVGSNVLYGYVKRLEADNLVEDFDNKKLLKTIKELLDLPYYEVEEVVEAECEPTVDIALEGAHDFVANGFITHNTNPCYIYCLQSNSICDDVTVVAHALGHNDFFKNNIFFAKTSQNMMNELANHGTRIRKYMRRWGDETVMEFVDHVLRIDTLIDSSNAWQKKKYNSPIIRDERKYTHPRRLHVGEGHDYMEDYINTPDFIKNQQAKIDEAELASHIGIFNCSTKDIMRYIRDHAPLRPWQSDIVAMLYEESMYFAPQRTTKMLNEGWASMIDYKVMSEGGFVALGQEHESSGIIEYATHKMGVLGGKYSMNPYKLGYMLFTDIEDRWNKGKFGTEWEDCTDMEEKRKWDKQLGLGKEKMFEVRKNYNDVSALMEFFTPEFCEKNEFFDWKLYPNGEYKIENRDPAVIKAKLIKRYSNGGLPEIKLVDPNHRGKGYMFLEHSWDGRQLHQPYAKATLTSIQYLWGNNVYLSSRLDDDREVVFCCTGPDEDSVSMMTREDYLKSITR